MSQEETPAQEVSEEAEFDAVLDSYLANNSFITEEPAAEAEEAEATTQDESPSTGNQAGTQAEAGQKEEAQEEQSLDAKRLALLARREEELRRERESISSQVEKQVQERVAEMMKQLRTDPVKTLKEQGIDGLSEVAAALWYNELGEDAPDEYRKKVQERTLRAEVDELKKRLDTPPVDAAAIAKQVQQASMVQAKEAEILSFASSIPDSMPYLQREVAHDAKEVQEYLAKSVALRINQNPDAPWPTVQEVAAEIEAELKASIERHVGNAAPVSTTQSPESPKRKSPTTLNDADTAARPSKRPKKPPETDEEWDELARTLAPNLFGK